MRASLLALLALLMLSTPAAAATIEQPLADPAQEAAARVVFHALKCVVCEGQSLADSDAKLAIQMRARVRDLIAQGQTEAEIIDFFRTTYGERILLAPPMNDRTALLWLAPLLLLAIGGAMVWHATRRNTVGES